MSYSGSQAAQSAPYVLSVALDLPRLPVLHYLSSRPVVIGTRVLVPIGRRQEIGIVVAEPNREGASPAFPELAARHPSAHRDLPSAPPANERTRDPSRPLELRSIERIFDDLPPLPEDWLRLCTFAADYYHRSLGEVMLPALPAPLRNPLAYLRGKTASEGPIHRLKKREAKEPPRRALQQAHAPLPDLTPAQRRVVDAIASAPADQSHVLFGVTGSGKTRVYLELIQRTLARGQQALLLVPEINLVPQVQRTLVDCLGQPAAFLHSALTDRERLAEWMSCFEGRARVLIGTRLALFTPMPELGLIIVDEEHDPSFKQQEGLRYSARDLALWRARALKIPVLLGSATPSAETWARAQSGAHRLHQLSERMGQPNLPQLQLLDLRRAPLVHGMTEQVLRKLRSTLDAGRQALIYLNRRGYAPVLHCGACGWLSGCDRCSAWRVVHRGAALRPSRAGSRASTLTPNHGPARLHCHHCGSQAAVPRSCPDCGNPDLQALGRGTQRLEEGLAELFPKARISRIDADSTRRKGQAEQLFEQVHAGEVDLLVGTQMVSKGHDFAHLGLVVVLGADTQLYSQDFRAPERLFAQLMQVAGRAGRRGQAAEVLVQTAFPDHPLYQALLTQDYARFMERELEERRQAGLPPFGYQALLTAQSSDLSIALAFLAKARDLIQAVDRVIAYDPVPLRIMRVNRVERAQLLLESSERKALHTALRLLRAELEQQPALAARVKWQLEIDPLDI